MEDCCLEEIMKEGYFPQEIEKRWQKVWEEGKSFKTLDESDKP